MRDPTSPRVPVSNSDAAFDALVREHYRRLCNFVVRFVGSRDVAEDIVQDVLTKVWRHWDDFDVRDPLPYLYQAVRNRAVSHRRRQDVRRDWEDRTAAAAGAGRAAASAASASSELEAGDLATAFARAVADLPERCRIIFTMSREQDLSYAEIAGVLGISIKTVETQMGRALKMLRGRLAPYLVLVMSI